ncbi:hypothetical protein PG999_002896 [Apiospora kogelbergensis]|uniref:Uncharacterized protein n=1 Tax=Apiospora kogelbergensis TaxID=1337665 RepID=A0AAW0R9U0_9PEZI
MRAARRGVRPPGLPVEEDEDEKVERDEKPLPAPLIKRRKRGGATQQAEEGDNKEEEDDSTRAVKKPKVANGITPLPTLEDKSRADAARAREAQRADFRERKRAARKHQVHRMVECEQGENLEWGIRRLPKHTYEEASI